MNLYIPIESFRNEQNVQSIKGKAIGLPDDFLALKEGSKGGGVIQVGFSISIIMKRFQWCSSLSNYPN